MKNISIWGKRFISEGEKRTTIYDIINRFESGENAKHQSGGGRPAKFSTNKKCLKEVDQVTILKTFGENFHY